LGTPEECKDKMYDTNLLSRHALAATQKNWFYSSWVYSG
jgi:hypothetical protein